MPLKQQLTTDMKEAMKARDSIRLNTIRFLMAEVKNVEIDKGELDEAGVQKIIASQVKKIKDTLGDFEKAGRDEIVKEEKQKIKILEKYLPQQMGDQELEKIVQEVIDGSDNKQMGPIIGQVMKKVAGQADGGRVSKVVQQLI